MEARANRLHNGNRLSGVAENRILVGDCFQFSQIQRPAAFKNIVSRGDVNDPQLTRILHQGLRNIVRQRCRNGFRGWVIQERDERFLWYFKLDEIHADRFYFCLLYTSFVAAAGYFAVIGGGELLDRLGEWADRTSGAARTLLGTMFGTLARERWVWITPVVLVLALYLSVIFQPGQAETGPVMYALF